MNRDCEMSQARLTEFILRQLDPAQEQELVRHLKSCQSCRREHRELCQFVGWLRESAGVSPSLQFREDLQRRLQLCDREEQELALSGKELWALRGRYWRLRIRKSPLLQLQLAAAAICLAVFAVTLLRKSPAMASPIPDETAMQWNPEPPAEIPTSKATGEHVLVAEQVTPPQQAIDSGWEPKSFLKPPSLVPLTVPLTEPTRATAESKVAEAELAPAASKPSELVELESATSPLVVPQKSAPPSDPYRRGLAWLERQQHADGSFQPGDGRADLRVAVTAMAVMAFVSEGYLGDSAGPHDRVVQRAADYLYAEQRNDGNFGSARHQAAACFNHTVATLALLERHVLLRFHHDGELAEPWSEQDRALIHALDRAESLFGRLFDARHSGLRLCEGENAAWSTLTLTLAEKADLGWQASFLTGQRMDAMLRSLRNERNPMGRAVSQSVSAMFEVVSQEEWDEWSLVVTPLLEDPASSSPALRFLVASALAVGSGQVKSRSAQFAHFLQSTEHTVLAMQHPEYGYFEPPVSGCFDGGDVHDTALSLLTLRVQQRSEALRAACR